VLLNLGAHARIRTGDLFLTKWSSIPGELELILAPAADRGSDHLTKTCHAHLAAKQLVRVGT